MNRHLSSPALLSTAFAAALLSALPATAAGPPPTPKEPVVDHYFGTDVTDPYRWLEGSAAPELKAPDPQLDARVATWTEAQNAYTRGLLDAAPGRKWLEARLSKLLEVGEVGLPRVRGGRLFYRERKGSEAQPVLYVREGIDGAPRALVDPNRLDPSGLTTLAWFTPSLDGTKVAYGLYRAGDENAVLHLAETADGKVLADEIPGKVEDVLWLPDGGAFVYRRLADVANPYSGQIRFHKLGAAPDADPILFEQYKEGPLATTWGPSAFTNDQARWLALAYWTGTASNDLWVYDLDAWRKSGKLARRDVAVGEDATFAGPIVGDTLYLLTTLDAPNGRVVAVDLAHPERAAWKVIVPERPGVAIQSVQAAKGRLVLTVLERATSRIEQVDLAGHPLPAVALPGLGTASVSTEEDSQQAFVRFTSFNEPESIYCVDLASGARKLWERPDVPVDSAAIEVEQTDYPSKDGTQVSMFLVHKKGLSHAKPVPTLLYGYGGFDISITPTFEPMFIPWIESGGLLAVANLRGGGEYGEAWHRAGMMEHKQNVFDDFIAAGEWLVHAGWTDPAHLGALGGSNGGLLTGAVLVQRPDLFRAVVSAVPLLDMLRYQHFLMARYWVPEYGSSEDREQFATLLRYSPYQNVKDGVNYPAVLLTAAENDHRVHPLHARKMAARLQAATASDPAQRPVLLWVQREAGHGPGMPLAIRVREKADLVGFLAWQCGLAMGGGG
jgi:prolyl oligopeptidase